MSFWSRILGRPPRIMIPASKGDSTASAPLASLDDARAWLEQACHANTRRYSTYDFGRAKDEGNISVVATEKDAERLLPVLRDRLGPGMIAFIGSTQWLGEESHRGVELVVARGQSQFDILRAARTDAINYDMETEDVIKRLETFDEQLAIDIIQAATDRVCFRISHTLGDVLALAGEIYELCPDIVDQGVGSVKALAAQISQTRMVQLWWD